MVWRKVVQSQADTETPTFYAHCAVKCLCYKLHSAMPHTVHSNGMQEFTECCGVIAVCSRSHWT